MDEDPPTDPPPPPPKAHSLAAADTPRRSPLPTLASGLRPSPPIRTPASGSATPKKKKFTDEDNQKITAYFEEYVRDAIVPSLSECREFLHLHPYVYMAVIVEIHGHDALVSLDPGPLCVHNDLYIYMCDYGYNYCYSLDSVARV